MTTLTVAEDILRSSVSASPVMNSQREVSSLFVAV